MKSRELFVNYSVSCDINNNRRGSFDDISLSLKKINETLLNFSVSMNFLRGDDKAKAINWLVSHLERIQSSGICVPSGNPVSALNDLFLDDLVWHVSDLTTHDNLVFLNAGLVIKNNKTLETQLSGEYYKKIVPVVETLLSGDLLCEIKLKPVKIDIDAELIQKEKRTITPAKKAKFSNENNI